mmetsp:Transcript_22126/g.69385  ORF Transcript_22126/g.69385 Transcript_22126/m.69385 type:complete len:800 (-) Transcript_22126:78-2477(-)
MASPEAPWRPRFESIKVDVVRALGRGAFGEVSLVKASPEGEEHLSAVFALKRTSLAQISEAGLEHAQSEAKLLQRLGEEHESILQCFDFRVVPGANAALELLLEFAPLGDLNGRIRAHKQSEAGSKGGLPEPEVVSYGCDVAAGLAHIHSLNPKVLHRDVKPANVVLFPTADGAGWDAGGTPRAKLADFGIAKVLEADGSLAGANTVIGTPHYFSPEICRGERYDERSDAWALGCVIYEMMCLHRPFHQAEGNIAVLALRVMEGRYDKDALVKQAGCYNGLLIFALTGLMQTDPKQRSRAGEALHPLRKLQGELTGGELQAAVPWWDVDAAKLAAKGSSSGDASAPTSAGADSWQGAEKVDLSADTQTVNPLKEAMSTLRGTVLPSPTWKRTSELLLDASGVPPLQRERSSPPTMMSPPTLDPRFGPPTAVPLMREHTAPPTLIAPPTLDPRMAPQRQDPATPTLLSPPTLDPRMAGAAASPVPDSTFYLSTDSSPQGNATFAGLHHSPEVPEEAADRLGQSMELGETVRLDFSQTGAQDSRASTVDLGKARTGSPSAAEDATMAGMAPSRIAWQGMTGMLDMMSEPPPDLGQSMRSEQSGASYSGRPQSSEAGGSAEFFQEEAQRMDATSPQPGMPSEGNNQTCWAEPRIFLRPLWRPAGAEPPPPDAPVMFCFTREESVTSPQAQEPPLQQQARARHYAEPVPENAEMPEYAQGPPQSFQPPHGPAHAAPPGAAGDGRVLTGRGSVLDPAHGWLEVELTVENAAALYAHMRNVASPQQPPQQQRGELGGIFELTAVA